MKLIFFMLVITLTIFPLQAANIYINTERNTLYIVVSPFDKFSIREGSNYNGSYGIHSGLGPNSGRSVNHYYTIPATPGLRSEKFINNSGTGSNGPGSY